MALHEEAIVVLPSTGQHAHNCVVQMRYCYRGVGSLLGPHMQNYHPSHLWNKNIYQMLISYMLWFVWLFKEKQFKLDARATSIGNACSLWYNLQQTHSHWSKTPWQIHTASAEQVDLLHKHWNLNPHTHMSQQHSHKHTQASGLQRDN